jgi:hypothetical protein
MANAVMTEPTTGIKEITAARDTDLPLGMKGYSFFSDADDEEKTTPAADDKSPQTEDAAQLETETHAAEKGTVSAEPEPAKPQPEPIGEELAARARALGLSDAEIKEFGSPRLLERSVLMAERARPAQTQPEPEKPAEAQPEPEIDWAATILDKFKAHEYGEELLEDVNALTGAFKEQLSGRDKTISELREAVTQINNRFMTEDFNRRVSSFDTWCVGQGEPWAPVLGKGSSEELFSSKAPESASRAKIFRTGDDLMARAAARGETLKPEEAWRRAQLIEFFDHAQKLVAPPKADTPEKKDETPRDPETGQFTAKPNASSGRQPRDEGEDADEAILAELKRRRKARGQ